MADHKPEFSTNLDGETVADAVRGHLNWVLDTWAKPFEVAIATAYFNPGGFDLIADALERVDRVRLLLGAQPSTGGMRVRRLTDAVPARAERMRIRDALTRHERDIEMDRDLLGFAHEVDSAARRLIEWLESGRVEVRRFEEGFLHGKAFIVTTDDEGVIAGSSNFTYSGLAKNLELNLGHYQPSVVAKVRDWFERLWEDAVPFDLAGLYEAKYEPHSPYLIYLKMLYERYGAEIEEEARDRGTGIHLTQFQVDGVWRAKRILARHNGVVVADGVGLGKSFIAGELIREAVLERRQRVLLVAPAALRDGPWRSFLEKHMLAVQCVSYEELAEDRQLNPEGTANNLRANVDEYAMVVIDEAHAFRNPDTRRASVLRRLLAGSPPKQVVMLSATPVNNSLWDLYYLLSYFLKNDAAFASAGIPSLRDHFAEAMALDPDDLSPDRLFDILDQVAVRRTRHFVKRYYPSDRIRVDGLEIPITFPKPIVHKVDYDLDEVLPGFFERLAHAIDCETPECGEHPDLEGEPVLSLARYVPSRFLRSVIAGKADPDAGQVQLSGLLRSGLLKRFESSAHAFATTCERMAVSHDAFLDLLRTGKVATGEVIREWIRLDTDDIEGFVENLEGLEPADLYDVDGLSRAVQEDKELLLAFASEARSVTPDRDPKLRRLEEELVEILEQAEEEGVTASEQRDKRKVIIFSHYADTARWINEHLLDVTSRRPELAAYRDRVVLISGNVGDRADAIWGFAPVSSEAPAGASDDRYDILVSTDVLAEGVNLQQARHIINVDLPWNPMRLVQRHGRIDRIGSNHDRVYIRCFFPDRQLDALLGLEERLHRKIKQAASSVGVEDEILPGSKVADITFSETREEIERLAREETDLLETGGEVGSAFSGEEYRQELRSGLSNPDLAEAIRKLPWGSGSGLARKGGTPGYVFCARVGDHPDPVFRFVDISDPDEPEIVGDTLAALSHAHATAETTRVLDDETYRAAYDAWEIARKDILDDWTLATDPANLQPKLPRAMKRAADLVRQYGPKTMSQNEVDDLVTRLEAPYGTRIVQMIRAALRDAESDPLNAVEEVARIAAEQGLAPSEPPKPLPVIELSDIHLVCWQAIVTEE